MNRIKPIKLPQTPITDETFIKQGWRKEVDDENPKDIQDWEETPFGKAHKKFTTNIADFDDIEDSEYDAVSIPKKSEPYIDDDYDY